MIYPGRGKSCTCSQPSLVNYGPWYDEWVKMPKSQNPEGNSNKDADSRLLHHFKVNRIQACVGSTEPYRKHVIAIVVLRPILKQHLNLILILFKFKSSN